MPDTPVILVHGFLASPNLLLPMKHRLQKRGHTVYLANLSPLCIQDVRRLARELSETVERVCFVEDVAQVDMVGVSLGGLIALYYQQAIAEQPRLRQLVAVGTPFLGTEFPRPFLPLLGRISAGVWQVLPDAALLKEMLAAGIPTGTSVTSIAMEGDTVSPPDACRLPGASCIVLPGRNTPINHQLLVASTATFEGIVAALSR
jgi:pimeloyl-ACP methyl ester carboxylesterase